MSSIPDPKAPRTRVLLVDYPDLALISASKDHKELDYRVTLPQGFHSVRDAHVCIAGVLKGSTIVGSYPGVIRIEDLTLIVMRARSKLANNRDSE